MTKMNVTFSIIAITIKKLSFIRESQSKCRILQYQYKVRNSPAN